MKTQIDQPNHKRHNMFALLIILGFFIVSAIWLTGCSESYPPLKGKYKVGTQLFAFKDETRNEWTFPDSAVARQYVVRVWYPAEPKGDETKLPIMEMPYAKGMQKLYGMPAGNGKDLSNSFQDAKAAKSVEKYPVLIFAHGAGSFPTQNLTSMEELASNGYVVFSLSFPYESVATIFPGGTIIPMQNMDEFKAGMKILVIDKEFSEQFANNIKKLKDPDANVASQASKDLGELYKKAYPGIDNWMIARIGDIHHLINNLNDLKIGDERLSDFADINNIGLFGHSLGAISTFQYLMMYNNHKVKCGITLDAPYVDLYANTIHKLNAPVLQLTSESLNLGKTKILMIGTNDFLKHFTDMPLYEVNVKGAAHYNFSDMNYLPSLMKMTPLLGSIKQSEAIKILSYYQITFFDNILKNDYSHKTDTVITAAVTFRDITN